MKAKVFATLAVLITGAVLLYAVSDFPAFGDPRSPANAGVAGGSPAASLYYIENTYRDTRVPNLVTAILADYRGYDTLFETVVIFTAGMAIFAILRVLRREESASGGPAASAPTDPAIDGDHHRIITGMTCRIAVPLVQIFALYVIAHGHHSPGGGFQGGVMLGASFILIALSTTLRNALARLGEGSFIRLACLGILIYAGFGFLPLVFGRNFLDYGALRGLFGTEGEEMARSHGIFAVEIGVALTVMSVMFAIFANLSSRGRLRGGL
jgi:multicomponent Na+:H+ antiporter subunit B